MVAGNWTTNMSGYPPAGDWETGGLGDWGTDAAGLPAGAIADDADTFAGADAAGADPVAGAAVPPPVPSSFGPMTSVTRCCHSFQTASGLFDGSFQVSRIASSVPLCIACTHTPSTVGANQRGLRTIWPTSGM